MYQVWNRTLRRSEPQSENTYLLTRVANKDSNQRAPPRTLIRVLKKLIGLCEGAGLFESSLGARPKVRFLMLRLIVSTNLK